MNETTKQTVIHAALSALGFNITGRVLSKILETKYPFIKMLPDALRAHIISYALSLLHSSVVTAYSTYGVVDGLLNNELSQEACEEDEEKSALCRNVVGNRWLLSFMCGYFVNDWISTMARHELAQYPADFMHHISSILLVGLGSAHAWPWTLYRFTPYITIIEGSTIPLDIMWFLGKAKMVMPKSKQLKRAHLQVMKLFAISFFFLRVTWLPIVVYILKLRCGKQIRQIGFGIVELALYVVCLLQFHWFRKIMLQFSSKK